jgi:hypothetical protein
VAYLAAGAVTVGGLALIVAATRQPAPPSPPPPAAVTRPAPPLSSTVGVRLGTSPPGAEVRFDGEAGAQGTTPLTLVMPRGDQPRRLILRLPGYRQETVVVVPVKDTALELALQSEARPKPVEKRPTKSKRPTARPVAAQPKTTSPNLRQGDVVDPFSR